MAENPFEIRWLRRAEKDLFRIVEQIAENAPKRAAQFGRQLQKAVESLNWSPARCPKIPEDPYYRHYILKRYRIIFEIDEKNRIVWIHAILFPYEQFREQGI